jgi:hypothetical protein
LKTVCFALGIDHFEYDISNAMAKIMFSKEAVKLDEIIDCIKHLGYEPHIAAI